MTGIVKFRLFVPLMALSLFGAIVAWADPPSQVGRLSFISGSVSFRPGSLDEWAPAMLNYPLTAGDRSLDGQRCAGGSARGCRGVFG